MAKMKIEVKNWHLALLMVVTVSLATALENVLEDGDKPCKTCPDWTKAFVVQPAEERSSYPSCAPCLEKLALLDLKTVLTLQNRPRQFPDLPLEVVIGYIKDAKVTIDAHANANRTRTSNKDPLKDFGNLWSEKWAEVIASKTARNSLAAYRLIFRIVRKFTNLIKTSEKFHQTLRKNLPATLIPLLDQLPSKNDLLEAALGIIRLQLVYSGDHNKMTSDDLIQGKIINVETGVTLDPAHCFHLGVVAGRKIKNYPIALQWFDLALVLTRNSTVENSNEFDHVTQTEFRLKLEREINDTVEKHNHHFFHHPLKPKEHTAKFFGGKLFPFPLIVPTPLLSHFHPTLEKYMKRFHSKESELRGRMFQKIQRYQGKMEPQRRQQSTLWDPNLIIYSYNELCSGADLLPEREKLKLFCWNERKASAFYLIGPMKMEFISRGPDIVQVYDVLGPKGIEKVERTAKAWDKKFKAGVSAYIKNGIPGGSVWDLFIATEAVIGREEPINWENVFVHGKELLGIAREPNHAITQYTFSGHFLPHVDFVCGDKFCKGLERLGTYMIYLSDVPIGGYTVFPHARVAVRPVKGSAVFWFNLEGNLNGDKRTMHAGCPPPLGVKMKLSQFVRVDYASDEWNCPLKNGQPFQVKVNGNK